MDSLEEGGKSDTLGAAASERNDSIDKAPAEDRNTGRCLNLLATTGTLSPNGWGLGLNISLLPV